MRINAASSRLKYAESMLLISPYNRIDRENRFPSLLLKFNNEVLSNSSPLLVRSQSVDCRKKTRKKLRTVARFHYRLDVFKRGRLSDLPTRFYKKTIFGTQSPWQVQESQRPLQLTSLQVHVTELSLHFQA